LGRTIRVVSTRYDGRPRDEHDAELLEDNARDIRIRIPRGTPVTRGGEPFELEPSDSVQIFMRDADFNVNHMSAVVPPYRNLWYANIALPPEFDGDELRWTDLYLDVMRDHEHGVLLKDVEEFERMARELPIPPELVQRVYAARDEVLRLAAAGAFPFDHAFSSAPQIH
jgi:protein associated with RNAse G/E